MSTDARAEGKEFVHVGSEGSLKGRVFRLVKEEEVGWPNPEPVKMWLAVDVVSGETRHFHSEHFDEMLVPKTQAPGQ